MLPTTEFAKQNEITKDEYNNYLKKYSKYKFVAETFDKISNAYVIIDSEGKLSTNNLHLNAYDVLHGSISEFEDRINFNQENEDMRYEDRKKSK